MEVRPARPADFDDIHPLLLELGNPRMSRDDWRRMLFDLPWPVEEEHRGHVLRDGGSAVGFLGTIFSARRLEGVERRFCNLSSWIVREPYRAASLQLVLPVMALRSHTLVNLTPSETAYQVFARLGFRTLETAQVLLPLWARAGGGRGGRAAVTADLVRLRAGLDEDGRRILDHMAGTRARQILLAAGGRRCHVVAVRSPWKGSWRLAHVLYASDWDLLWEHPGAAARAFLRLLGTVGLRVDRRHLRGPLPAGARERALGRPFLYRPAAPEITPERVDGLYTEAVGQRW